MTSSVTISISSTSPKASTFPENSFLLDQNVIHREKYLSINYKHLPLVISLADLRDQDVIFEEVKNDPPPLAPAGETEGGRGVAFNENSLIVWSGFPPSM